MTQEMRMLHDMGLVGGKGEFVATNGGPRLDVIERIGPTIDMLGISVDQAGAAVDLYIKEVTREASK